MVRPALGRQRLDDLQQQGQAGPAIRAVLQPAARAGTSSSSASQVGVSPILCYDPPGRVVATIHPNQTYEKVVFDPWHQETWDVNDTCFWPIPAADPDVGDFFPRLPAGDYSPTWYRSASGAALAHWSRRPPPKPQRTRTRRRSTYFDPLGRTFLSVADNGPTGNTFARRARHPGQPALGHRPAGPPGGDLRLCHPGERIHQASMEAGQRWMLNDVTARPSAAGTAAATTCAGIRRAAPPPVSMCSGPTRPTPTRAPWPPNSATRQIDYGEGQANAQTLNLRTRVFRHCDTAGVVINMTTDPVTEQQKPTTSRAICSAAAGSSCRTRQACRTGRSRHRPFFRTSSSARTQYDALNRVDPATAPDGSVRRPPTTRPTART